MDKAQARVGHVIVGVILEVPSESIDQGAVEVAVARVHDHAGGLVDDHQAGVFIDDVQRDVLGDDFALIAGTIHHHADDVTGVHAVVALDRTAVHSNALCLSGILDAVAAGALDALYEVLVDAQQYLARLHHIVVVLPIVAPVLGKVGLTVVVLNFVAARLQFVVEQLVVQCHF